MATLIFIRSWTGTSGMSKSSKSAKSAKSVEQDEAVLDIHEEPKMIWLAKGSMRWPCRPDETERIAHLRADGFAEEETPPWES